MLHAAPKLTRVRVGISKISANGAVDQRRVRLVVLKRFLDRRGRVSKRYAVLLVRKVSELHVVLQGCCRAYGHGVVQRRGAGGSP